MAYYIDLYSSQNEALNELIQFFRITEKKFVPPISDRVDLFEYIEKLITEATVLTAKDQPSGEIIGVAAYYCNPQSFDLAFLSYIAVNSDQKGIGSSLVEEMIRDCKKRGAKGIKTQTWVSNKRSMALFYKFGFIRTAIENNRGPISQSSILELIF